MVQMIPALAIAVTVLPGVAGAGTKVAVLKTALEGKAKTEVPSLIDDYVLTAVQDLGDFEVIGSDDVKTVIGFEKEKELLGCDDVACMADIAGALGVDEIVVFKVARAGPDWATTAKLIDIRNMRVKSRTTDFVAGDSRQLLGAIPDLMRNLFAADGGGAPTAVATQAVVPEPEPAPVRRAEPAVTEPTSDEAPVYESPWFWVGIGAAVAAGVAVAVVLATGGENTMQTPPSGNLSTTGDALISW